MDFVSGLSRRSVIYSTVICSHNENLIHNQKDRA